MKPKLTHEQLNRNNTNSASGSSGFSSGESDDENIPYASDLTNDFKLNSIKINRNHR
jgi:hypothetical protein